MTLAPARCSVSRRAARASGSASGSSPPWSPLVQPTRQPSDPASIQRAAVPAGPNSASSGCAAMTMNLAGRHVWSARGSCAAGSVIGPPGAPRAGAGSRRVGRLELVQHRDDVGRVAFRFDLGPDTGDPAVGIDQECRPRHAPVRLAVILFLDPRPVSICDRVILVGEEREGQLELLAERALAGRALRADSPHVRAALVDRLVAIAELTRLHGAAGRVVLGVEVEDGPPAVLVGEAMDGPRLIREGDLGGQVADGRNAHEDSLAGDSTTSSRPCRTMTAA